MKINKETWHYKLWKKSFHYREEIPEETDLCRYCHKVFWQLIGIGVLASMILTAIGCCLVLLFMLAYQGFYLHTLTTLKVIGVGIVVVVPIVFYVRWLNNKNVRKASNSNLVSQFISAKKQSVCPLVEFSDDDDC